MSSTNVHSNNETTNYYIVGAYMVPTTEKVLEIPPKSYNEGPTIYGIEVGENMDIMVEDSEIREDGKWVNKEGKQVGKVSKKTYQMLSEKYHKNDKAKIEEIEEDRSIS